MTVTYRIAARAVFLAIFIVAAGAAAHGDAAESSGSSWLDTWSGWLGDLGGYLGEQTDKVLAPGFPRLGAAEADLLQGLTLRARSFHESYPVRPGCEVSISNTFGEIRVQTWENPRVQVYAEITAGAEAGDIAQQLADTTVIEALPTEGGITVRTIEPSAADLGKVAIEVNYVITVPQDANVVCENYFGDTVVHGVGGAVTVKSEFGLVDLRGIGGPVEATARGGGEFAFLAYGLRQGGQFDLRRTESEFVDVAGELKIDSYMGSVTVRDLASESNLDIRSYNGLVSVFVEENSEPDISAMVKFGSLKSDLPLSRSSRGVNRVVARNGNIESRQRVTANVSFADLHIIQEGQRPLSRAQAVRDGEAHVRDPEKREFEVPEDIEIVVDATVGDIRIEGIDEARLYVDAEKLVVLGSNANAQAAFEALPFTVERLDGRVRIRTAADRSISSLGCTYYRTDLTIKCPRTASLRVTASSGHTDVSGTGGDVTITQEKGRITVEHAKGRLDLTNRKGDVLVRNCAGPVDVSVNGGNAETYSIFGKQAISCVAGKTVIDEPGGDVVVRNRGGDARIMALKGVAGNYDVNVEDGNLSILLSQASNNAALSVTARNGTVDSAVLLHSGTVEKGVRTFSGGAADGEYRVQLVTKNGNIIID